LVPCFDLSHHRRLLRNRPALGLARGESFVGAGTLERIIAAQCAAMS
jgi:hypothetical protein